MVVISLNQCAFIAYLLRDHRRKSVGDMSITVVGGFYFVRLRSLHSSAFLLCACLFDDVEEVRITLYGLSQLYIKRPQLSVYLLSCSQQMDSCHFQ